MFPKSKRFQEAASCAPAVGSYNVDNLNKKPAAVLFPKSKRFRESKENLPGPSDTSSFLDISVCSTSSRTSVMNTPKSKIQDKTKLQGLERTIDSLKQELSLLREQNQALQVKASVEKSVILREDKLVSTEDDLWNNEEKNADCQSSDTPSVEMADIGIGTDGDPNIDLTVLLANKEKELVNLQLIFKCEQENCKADIDLERTRNVALKTRISALEKTNQEILSDRDNVEEENKKLQGFTDELRKENVEIMRKLDIVEQDLEITNKKLALTTTEAKEKIESLQAVVNEEVMKAKVQEKKYAESIKASEENFTNAMKKTEDLHITIVCYENKIDDLKQRLEQVAEQEQRANEDLGCLAAEKLSLESQLKQCCQDYEQRLQLAAQEAEKLQEEIKSNEQLMTDNLKALTAKYTALEETHAKEKSSAQKELQIALATLDVTRASLSNSKQEHEELISTFDNLKNQLSDEQHTNDYLVEVSQDLVQQLFSNQCRTKFLEKELGEVQEAAQETKVMLEEKINKKQEIIINLESEQEGLVKSLNHLTSIEKSQSEKLSNALMENECLKNEKENEIAELQHLKERCKNENENLKKEMKNKTDELEQKAKVAEEKALKIKEEFGRRLVETQKKLSQNEINQIRAKEENSEALRKIEDQLLRHKQEHEKEKEEIENMYKRMLHNAQDEIENLKEKLNRHNNDAQIEDLKQQIELWQNKYEELEKKIEPFKEQLDAFEAEKKALLSQNSEALNEVTKLGAQYAKLLGHQNQKQKIHHVLKLKQENIDLKSENSKLREQCEKQKRGLKRLEEKVDYTVGKKKFNPADAFSHAKKENRGLAVLSHGNVSIRK